MVNTKSVLIIATSSLMIFLLSAIGCSPDSKGKGSTISRENGAVVESDGNPLTPLQHEDPRELLNMATGAVRHSPNCPPQAQELSYGETTVAAQQTVELIGGISRSREWTHSDDEINVGEGSRRHSIIFVLADPSLGADHLTDYTRNYLQNGRSTDGQIYQACLRGCSYVQFTEPEVTATTERAQRSGGAVRIRGEVIVKIKRPHRNEAAVSCIIWRELRPTSVELLEGTPITWKE